MIEMKVVDSLTLPDMALVRLKDPKGDAVDSHPLQLGKDLEIKVVRRRASARRRRSSRARSRPSSPSSARRACVISIRAYDKAHKLNRQRKTRTFQQMSASDMVKKIAGESGLCPKSTSTSVVHEFFQQSNETDWDFVWRLALMHDFEVVVKDTTLEFRPANKADGAPGRAQVPGHDDLVPPAHDRRAAAEDGQHPRLGSEEQAGRHRHRRQRHDDARRPACSARKVSNDLGGGTTAVADRVAANNGEANALAKSTLNRMSDAFFEADGVAFGNPKIKAGSKVQVQGVGQQFSGTYTVTSSTHSYRGATGYQTAFQISGRSSRTLLELMRPPQERDWSASLVVGVVTNNNDPDQMGRVRVKYPSLSDSEESAWARIATPERGQRARPADAARSPTRRSSSASSTATRAARSSSARSSTAATSPAPTCCRTATARSPCSRTRRSTSTPRRTSRSSPTRT